MFNKELSNLTLTSDIANDVFPRITGDRYNYDNSFLATLRALLAPRMSEDDRINIRVRIRNDREAAIKAMNDKDAAEELSRGIENNTVFVCGFNGTENCVTLSFKKIESCFLKSNPNYKELEDLHVFMSKQANVRFYINEETRSVAIFAGCLNIRTWHFIQSLTSRFLPWYFTDKPLSDDEKSLVRSLTKKLSTTYEELIEKSAEIYDFRTKRIFKILDNFEKDAKRGQLSEVQRSIISVNNDIENYMRCYSDCIEKLDALRIKECGLTYQIENGECNHDFAEFIARNKHVNIIEARGTTIKMYVDCTLENYDPDLYERMFKNDRSYLFIGYNPTAEVFASLEARKKFLNAVFSDERCLKIKLCGYFVLDTRGNASSEIGHHFPEEYNHFLSNPHFHHHACLGNNRPIINKCLKDGDYMGAVIQCISAASNLNFSEGSQTVAPFLEKVFAARCNKIILLPNGESVTPTEAYNWLLSQEEQKQEENK